MNVEGAGIKLATWRNWENYFLVFFICTMALATYAGGRVGVSGMSHIPSDILRLPVRMVFFLIHHLEFFLLKMAWKSSPNS